MNHFKKKSVLIAINILLVQCLSLLPMPALADDGAIKIAGQPVFSVTSAGDSGSLAKRAEAVQNNLDNALVAAQDRTPASVNITYVKGMPVITLGGYQVVTIGGQDAVAAHTTPALLASQWADAIRGSLVNQASVNSYVAQLSGNYALSAPAANLAGVGAAAGGAAAGSAIANASAPSYGNSGNNAGGQVNSAPSNYPPPNAPATGVPANYESYNNSNPNSNAGNYSGQPPGSQGYRQGRVIYAPAGQIIPITLKTAIATQVAKVGDLLEASTSQNINLGDSSIPAGTKVIGQVASAKAGGRLTKSGEVQIKFTQLEFPDGSTVPITAHIVGGIGKYAKGQQADQVEGETWKNKVGSVAFRGLLGAGAGAALGTGVGAIAGGGYGAGMGAWSGAAIGSGVGAADSLILRKGKDVTIPTGTNIQLQLDAPVTITGGMPQEGYNNNPGGNYNGGGYGASSNQYPVGGGNYAGGANPNQGGGYNAGGYGGNLNQSGGGNGGNYNGGAPGGGYNPPQQQYNPPQLR